MEVTNKWAPHQFYTHSVYYSGCENSCTMSPDALSKMWKMVIRIIYKYIMKGQKAVIYQALLIQRIVKTKQTWMPHVSQRSPFKETWTFTSCKHGNGSCLYYPYLKWRFKGRCYHIWAMRNANISRTWPILGTESHLHFIVFWQR